MSAWDKPEVRAFWVRLDPFLVESSTVELTDSAWSPNQLGEPIIDTPTLWASWFGDSIWVMARDEPLEEGAS